MQDTHFTTGKGKVHPRTGHEGPQREERYSSTLSLTLALDEGGWSTPRPGRFTPRERDPVPIVQEAGWAPGPVWTGAESIAPTGIRSPDRPARSESLHRLRYPGPLPCYSNINKLLCFLDCVTVTNFVFHLPQEPRKCY